MVEVQVQGVTEDHLAEVVRVGERALAQVERADSELSVLLCDDDTIRSLNAEFRHRDAPTDVLSFPQGEDRLLGDVVISVPTAARQAAAAGHPVGVEVALLLVHGLLHLLGYDHQTVEEAAEMRSEEDRLLAAADVLVSGLVGRESPH